MARLTLPEEVVLLDLQDDEGTTQTSSGLDLAVTFAVTTTAVGAAVGGDSQPSAPALDEPTARAPGRRRRGPAGYAGAGASSSARSPASSSTCTPRRSAFSSLEPGDSPATT